MAELPKVKLSEGALAIIAEARARVTVKGFSNSPMLLTALSASPSSKDQIRDHLMRDTETLDRLYLEWSQFTTARNKREIEMLAALDLALNWFTPPNDSRGAFPLKQIAEAADRARVKS